MHKCRHTSVGTVSMSRPVDAGLVLIDLADNVDSDAMPSVLTIPHPRLANAQLLLELSVTHPAEDPVMSDCTDCDERSSVASIFRTVYPLSYPCRLRSQRSRCIAESGSSASADCQLLAVRSEHCWRWRAWLGVFSEEGWMMAMDRIASELTCP